MHFSYCTHTNAHVRVRVCTYTTPTHTQANTRTYTCTEQKNKKITILQITCKVNSHITRDSILTHILKWHDGEHMLWYKVFTLCLLEKLYVHPDDQAQTHKKKKSHTVTHIYNYTTIIGIYIYIYGSSFESVFHNEQTESNILIWLICHVFIITIPAMPQILEFIHTTDTTI